MKDNEVLIQLNDSTDGRLFSLIVDKCSENHFQIEANIEHNNELKNKTQRTH